MAQANVSEANVMPNQSQRAEQIGQVAQLVEQRTENPRVGSSILPLATTIQRPTYIGWAF